MSVPVVVETRDRITRIRLDRPEKKNALTAAMYQALADALRAADADSSVRCVLIHGQPDCFSAGNDLADFAARPDQGDDAPVTQFLRAVSTAAKPLVAAVGGSAVGIGTTMLLHCDFVYATPDTRFQLPFVRLGLVPEAASGLLLPMIAGYQRAAELLLLGRPFGADQALAAGIVTAVVPTERLIDHAHAIAAEIAALPPTSMRLSKALIKRAIAGPVAEQMAEESRHFRAQLGSDEAKEAIAAFFEKRPADFSRF